MATSYTAVLKTRELMHTRALLIHCKRHNQRLPDCMSSPRRWPPILHAQGLPRGGVAGTYASFTSGNSPSFTAVLAKALSKVMNF
jgi:hypothetical protein